MSAALSFFQPGADADAPGADPLPDFLDFRPARPERGHLCPSIRVFTDTMAPGFALGRRVTVRPCGLVPLFPAAYLVALRGAGFALARLRPLLGGGFALSYDNPAYEGWTVTQGAVNRGDVQALCHIVQTAPADYGCPNR